MASFAMQVATGMGVVSGLVLLFTLGAALFGNAALSQNDLKMVGALCLIGAGAFLYRGGKLRVGAVVAFVGTSGYLTTRTLYPNWDGWASTAFIVLAICCALVLLRTAFDDRARSEDFKLW
jgi:hypothetical protein